MAQNVTLYNLLISCPGDIKEEVTLIESAVDEFNELYAETLGITIKTRHWSKSSYAQSGGKPQALLNEQFVNKCDAAVAIFWTRFGSPTDEYGSGTEEEIEIMLQSGKQVFMYFSDKPIPPSKINGDGYEKIQAFRDKYKDKGIYFTYSSDEEFKKMFFAHLSMHFLTEKRVSETANEYRSELKLLGIDETGRLTEEAVVCPFVLNAEITMKEYITSIKNMYQEISDMNVGGRSVTANTFFAGFTSPVDIDEDEKEFITAVAEQLERKLSDSFFELGNLNQDTLTSNLLSGPKLNGTSEEKQKYWKIKRLHETISKALEWAPVEKAFSGMNCIKLAIQNCGKAIDEDAEIMFEVPKESLLTLGEFPKFNNAEIGYLLTDCDMSILFGIEGTSEYIEYSESEQNGRTSYGARPYGLPGYVPDYSDDFTDEIKDVFCYGFYSSEDSAKVLAARVVDLIDEERSPQKLLTNIYNYLLGGVYLPYLRVIDTYERINNFFLDYFGKGKSLEALKSNLWVYRNEIYENGDPDSIFYVDILVAVIIVACENSSWSLLPSSSGILDEEWESYLQSKMSIKMLWPAQRLIAEKGLLRGESSIVQLPTGVGKTRSIELIIRAAFLSERANIAIIVAPLRALCNEITMDMYKAFGNDVTINQFSDVLQNDFWNLFSEDIKRQILICTPEKLSYVLHHDPFFLSAIDLFVFDEGHMFDDGGRGATYELLVTHIRQNITSEQQLVLLSAVLPNSGDIAQWLFEDRGCLATDDSIVSTPKSIGFSSTQRDIHFFSDDKSNEDYYIPRILRVEQLKKLPRERSNKYFPDLSLSTDVAIYNAIKLCHNGGVAIYLGQQRSMKTVFERIINLDSKRLNLG